MGAVGPIPQANPRANYLAHKDAIDAAITRVLDGGRYILGDEVESFEREFAAFLGVRFGIGVGSGTEALHVALRACGIGPGDIVVTVSHTAVATVAAIELCGATPMLVDIDPATFTIDPNRVEDAVRRLRQGWRGAGPGRPRAIVPVHLYGHPSSMDSLTAIARQYELRVVEDCAQSHGAGYRGRKTGAWGDIAAFSFYPTKNLGALGDGGMVVTDDPELAEAARLIREYGWRERYVSELPGFNSRLDELQAAVLRVKLRHLESENERRRALAAVYGRRLQGAGLELPTCRADAVHVYHQYVVRCEQRDALRAALRAREVGTAIHYPVPVHLQAAYRSRVRAVDGLGHSEAAAAHVLSLPIYPELSVGDAEEIAGTVRSLALETQPRA